MRETKRGTIEDPSLDPKVEDGKIFYDVEIGGKKYVIPESALIDTEEWTLSIYA